MGTFHFCFAVVYASEGKVWVWRACCLLGSSFCARGTVHISLPLLLFSDLLPWNTHFKWFIGQESISLCRCHDGDVGRVLPAVLEVELEANGVENCPIYAGRSVSRGLVPLQLFTWCDVGSIRAPPPPIPPLYAFALPGVSVAVCMRQRCQPILNAL